MKKLITKILILVTCMTMVVAISPMVNVQAAAKSQGTIDLQKKMLSISNGKKTAIKKNTLTIVKGCSYQVRAMFGKKVVKSKAKWKSTKSSVVKVSKTGLITSKSPGKSTIKITYKGRVQTLKIKVIASHKHTWKVTKKATCEAKGKQICTVCGTTESIAKTKHTYITKTNNIVEGRGTPKEVVTVQCGSCGVDMTNWTKEEIDNHRSSFDNWDCFDAPISNVIGVKVYPKYVMVEYKETYCKTCGAWDTKNTTQKELYECDNKGNRLTSSSATSTADKTVTANAAAASQDVIEVPEISAVDVPTVYDNIVADNDIISGNETISDNIADTGNNGGGSEIVVNNINFTRR